MSQKRHFLIISQVFSPDPAAVGQYFDEAAKVIAKTGAGVTLLTANRGYDNPEKKFSKREIRDGIEIRRLPFSSFGKANLVLRIFAQLCFLTQCILRGFSSTKTTDLLVSTSPPMAAITAVVIGLFRPNMKVHYWVMDINPDQAIALGAFTKGHPLVIALDWLNRRMLKRADSVIALDRFMKARLEQKLERPSVELRNSIQVIPPWPMDDYLAPIPHTENIFRKAQGWKDKFVIMYSGNHSLVHPLDTLLEAAELLRNDKRFVFAFIGGGKGKEVVEKRIHRIEYKYGPSSHSIQSLPYQPLEKICFSLSAADLHVVSLGDKMSGIVHPCKIYGVLRIDRPLIALCPEDSYLKDIFEKDTIGWTIRHGETANLIKVLLEAIENKQNVLTTPKPAKSSTMNQFSRSRLLSKFTGVINL